jgi:ribonuclease D
MLRTAPMQGDVDEREYQRQHRKVSSTTEPDDNLGADRAGFRLRRTMIEAREDSWIATDAALSPLVEAVAASPLIAVDTEFVREKTYYPQLCVVQIATRDYAACIDCLAPFDLEPLYAELFRPERTWVLHSARQDLEVVWQRAGRMPPKLIDTQIAAALLGWPPQLGLEGLLKRTLDVDLGESYARTDWSRRPLPPAELNYAIEDVRYLLRAWDELEKQLAALGRLDWLREECERTLAELPEADPTAVWSRIKGVHALSFPAACAALELVRWRERAAQRSDRPRRWLLDDERLLALAAALPRSADDLRDLVAPKFVDRNATDVLAAVARRDDPEVQAIVRAHSSPPADRKVLKALQEEVRRRAGALAIEPEILATRRELAALALGHAPEHLRQGWRAAQLAGLETTAAAAP